jgi:hypothetical protein
VIEVLAEENVQQAKSKGHALHVQNKTVIELESKAQEELADAVIEFISSRGEATLRDIKRGPGQRKGARDAIENLLDEMVEDGRIGRESCPLKNGQEAYRFFIPESE